MPGYRTHRTNQGDMYIQVRPNKNCMFAMRLVQMMLAIAFASLLLYSGFHKGWWLNITVPVALGSEC